MMSNVTLEHTPSQEPGTTDCSVQQFKVYIGSRAPHCRTVLQNWQDKTPKASPKKRSIMEHSPGLLQDTKSLKNCSRSQAKMILKGHLESNVAPNITRSSDSFSTVQLIVNGGDWGCIVRDLETIIVFLGVTRIQFHSPNVTPLTNPAEVTDQGLFYCNSNTWGQHNHQSVVISITHQLILQNSKNSEVYRRNDNRPKIWPCGIPDTTLTSLLRQPSTVMCCDRFDRNCVNIDNTPSEKSLQRMP